MIEFLDITGCGFSQSAYDLLLQGGHVIDPKNGISAVPTLPSKMAASQPWPAIWIRPQP
jgi:hypothetical protein